MSKSLNAMLSAMLLFSLVAPTASAETTDPSSSQLTKDNLNLLLYQNITINIRFEDITAILFG
ncbi:MULTISPECIES: hypothetical protein [unclassified Lysinibacillus]|uniref:hypothetical protein n=1 Tax=unclassified Lysinibacillus TaxID=2636778 RepID=UPI0038048C4C